MRPLRLVVSGADGRMGRAVWELARADARFSPVAGLGRGNASGAAEALRRADALVDFTSAEGALAFGAKAAAAGVPMATGSTGFTAAQKRRLASFARRVPLLAAPNMSPGMNLLFALAERAAAALPGWDAGISETHHAGKKDAPSGSALRIAEAVAAARGGRAPQVRSLRLGDVVGEHSLTLAGPEETLELVHRARSRAVFARGALEAALWLRGRRPGLYSMRDVLGIRP